jgi:predicted helicase
LFISQPKCVTSNKTLLKLHIHYEQQPEFPLERIETGELNWHVEKMKLSKDKTELRYNSFLTLRGIPPEVSEYRVGNRSALEWISRPISGLHRQAFRHRQRPHRDNDPEYILRLIGQVIHVSVETVKRIREVATLACSSRALTRRNQRVNHRVSRYL